jgi:single-strand DNA-binding protein
MSSYNRFIGMGNLTRDPETKYTPNGVAVCTFGVAMNHKYIQGTEKKEEVCYLDAVVFGKFSDVCQKYLTKGQGVLVDGRLRQRRWNDKATGVPRTKMELIVEKVLFLSKSSNGSGQASEPGEATPVDDGEIPF